MPRSAFGRMAAAVSITALAVTATIALPSPAHAAASSLVYSGSAYGSTVSAGAVQLGKTSAVSLCSSGPSTSTANAAGVQLPNLGTIGAVTTKVKGSSSGGTVSTTTTTETAGVNLLGGLITASNITTEAVASRSASGIQRTGKSVLTGLRVAGLPVSATPSKNAGLKIPGIAELTLNGQSTATSYGSQDITVTALKVKVLSGNGLGLPVGTIVVGSAKASMREPVNHRAYGWAYGTQIEVGKILSSGPTSAVYLPCGGSDGATVRNSTAAVNLGAIVKTGAVSTRATSSDTASKTVAATSSTIAGINLLGGAITVDAITAKATVTRQGSKFVRSSTGTEVTGLKINGEARSITVAPNTSIDIAGIGTLYLRRVVESGNGVSVDAIALKLLTARDGLAAGTIITVGSAKAGVTAD